MATHGTIWLTNTEEKGAHVLMQTHHTGHTHEAIAMLCDMPRFVAEKKWYAEVIARHLWEEEPIVEQVLDFARSNGDFGELHLLGLASWITSYHFDFWRIIPAGFENYLPDYDLDPAAHIYVELNPIDENGEAADGFLICEKFDEFKEAVVYTASESEGQVPVTLEAWINNLNASLTDQAKISPYWEGLDKKGIFVPFSDSLVEFVAAEVVKKVKK